MYQIQFNLKYLTTHGSIQKGNPFILGGLAAYPCPFIFYVLLNRILYQPLLYLNSNCSKFTLIAHFKHSLSADPIANSDVVFNQDRLKG